MTPDTLALAEGFERVSHEDWLAAAARSLGQAGAEGLRALTVDGLAVDALERARREASPLPMRSPKPWHVLERIDHPDPAEAGAQARAALKGGANGLALVLSASAAAHGQGLEATDIEAFARALGEASLETSALALDAGGQAEAAAALLAAWLDTRGLDPAALDLSLGLDPVCALAATGSGPGETIMRQRLADTAHGLAARGFPGDAAFAADGRLYHAAGAGPAEELAAIAATGLTILRALEDGGLDIAAWGITFRVACDADPFVSLAKLRALRLVWRRVLADCGAESASMRVEAQTAWRMTSRDAPRTNLIRNTLAAFAAAAGGADAITVLPHDLVAGAPGAHGRRMARNTQLLLAAESHLHRIADPAAGAGALEALTDAIAAQAWDMLREIEAEGGIVGALRSGSLQTRIAASAARRAARLALRQDLLIGVNAYPFLDPDPAHAPAPPTAGARPPAVHAALPEPGQGARFGGLVNAARAGGGLAVTQETDTRAAPLTPSRLAEPFERLRAAAAARETAPSVFLAAFGPPAAYGDLADLAANAFAVGGIAALPAVSGQTQDEMASAFARAGTPLACLCAPDGFADEAARLAETLRQAGADFLALARPPAEDGTPAPAPFDAAIADAPGAFDLTELLARAHAVSGPA